MATKPELSVVGGTDTEAGSFLDTKAGTGAFEPIGIVDAQGRHFFRGPPRKPPGGGGPDSGDGGGGKGGGSDVTSIFKLDIPRDVQIAKWGLAVLFFAFGSAFLYFIAEFKDVRKDLSTIQSSVSAQAATTNAIQATLTRIEDKLDKRNDNAEASPPAGQDRGVPSGAPKRP